MAFRLPTLHQAVSFLETFDNVRASAPKPYLYWRCVTRKGHFNPQTQLPNFSVGNNYVLERLGASCPSATTPGAEPAGGIPRPPSPTAVLNATEANIIALETVMGWNLKTLRQLVGVQPVPLTPEWSRRIREAVISRQAATEARQDDGVRGVVCPWLPNPAAVRQLLSQGFKVVAVECSAGAVEQACLELGMGPEERGIHDGWVRHAMDVQSSEPAGYLYRGNPYNLTPPVLSLVPFPLHAVWDVWGLMITPPELLPRYASVWAALLPRGGVWLAAACVRHPSEESSGPAGLMGAQIPAAASTTAAGAGPLRSGTGLYAHDLHGVLIPTLERAGFTVEVFIPPGADPRRRMGEGADSNFLWAAVEDLFYEEAEALLSNGVLKMGFGAGVAGDGCRCQLQLMMLVIKRT
ncbi:hypothetical protein Vretimale_12136 [Volvox reticuliferus]|uniref:Uncharacterized protein n=1 Tax=Volvox reticuliferus TaxID=1737510 RepID=A0A8J4GHT4_9CHLO|nr:hypothetical protein Vretifemale_9598 [Volvox reticuliferus]GIM08043.1 hypothetical protein Vretimale_12136 [Volvox reticuliferus]